MLRTPFAALALAAAVSAMSGCGGSSKTVSSTAPTTRSGAASTPALPPATPVTVATGTPLTRAQLLASADAICARRNARVESVAIQSSADFIRMMPQIAIYNTTQANELSKLVPPASMRSVWTVILTDFHRYGEYMNRLAAYAPQRNPAVLGATLKSSERLRARLDALAKREGFKQCSKRRA